MKKAWSSSWKSSKQPRKQRKYVYNAPAHIKRKLLGVHLSKELKQKYNCRSIMIRKGDKVKVLRGSNKNQIGKVDRVDLTNLKIYITGLELTKKDGSKTFLPFRPSNLMVLELDLSDKKRESILKRKSPSKEKSTTKPLENKKPEDKNKEKNKG